MSKYTTLARVSEYSTLASRPQELVLTCSYRPYRSSSAAGSPLELVPQAFVPLQLCRRQRRREAPQRLRADAERAKRSSSGPPWNICTVSYCTALYCTVLPSTVCIVNMSPCNISHNTWSMAHVHSNGARRRSACAWKCTYTVLQWIVLYFTVCTVKDEPMERPIQRLEKGLLTKQPRGPRKHSMCWKLCMGGCMVPSKRRGLLLEVPYNPPCRTSST